MVRKLRLGYARVSTASGEQRTALEHQKARLVAAGVERVIEDVQSGLESDRTGYLELLQLVAAGKVAEVVITRVDRLGRNAADTDMAIALCAKRGVVLTALDGGVIETETPGGFLLSRVLTSLAEMESRMLSLRVKAGLEQGRKAGRPLRGRAPWGYRVSADKRRFEPDPVEWPRAQAFLALLRSMSWRMTPAMDRWEEQGNPPIPLKTCRGVKAWLVNPVLRGGTGYHQQKNHVYAEIAWNTHEPLIPPAEWESVQGTLQQNRRMWGSNARRAPRVLTSVCRCEHCGHAMAYAPAPRRIPAVMCKQRGCAAQYKSTREELIVPAINAALADHARELAQLVGTEPEEAVELRAQIKYLEALNDPDVSDAIASKRDRLSALLERPPVDELLVASMQDLHFFEALSAEELRQLYQQLVRAVWIRDQAVARVDLAF
jgi:DNA invertase Pin-like site-specific DNA recombinase